MKKHLLLTIVVTLTGLLFNVARAQENPTRATITAVKGSSTVKLANGSSVPASVGLQLSEGAAITSGHDAQVSIQAHEGIVAVLAGSSHIEIEKLSVGPNGMRNTIMNLRNGHLASSLDPAKKNINNFGVRTDRGLAMARGTTMTVSVSGNVYTVSVIAGAVTVNWAGGLSVSIVGNTPSDVTSNSNGQVNTVSLSTALASGQTPGLSEALMAAAAAVATVATTPAQVTSVIDAIATASGSSSSAASTVAGATAAATEAAVTNSTLVAAAGSTTAVASTISTAAVTSATAAGNGSAAALIVTSAVNAVATTVPGTNVNAVAAALTSASNSVQGNTTVNAGLVTAGVNAAQNPATLQGTPPAADRGNTVASTPITPIDPSINVSPSGD